MENETTQPRKEKVFADGMMFQNPPPEAPEWLLGKISVRKENFTAFLEKHTNERGWANFDVKKAKNGNIYVELNTYERKQ